MKRFKLISTVALVLVISMVFSMIGSAITVPGDYDKSKKVTASDAIYLLKNTLFGDEEYPLYYAGDLNDDGRIDSDDAVYMLYNSIFGTEDYPIPEVDKTGRIPIYFNNVGKINSYELLPGDPVPEGNDYITDKLVRYSFLGWYDATLTTKYETIPDHIVTMYAKYDRYISYSYDNGGIYDPNNRNMIEIVKDPFGGNGNVLHTIVINSTAEEYNGTFRGLSPSVYDSKTNEGFKVENGHRYQISFKYRYNEDAPSNASCSLAAFAVSADAIHMTLNSSNRKQLSASYSSSGGGTLSNKGKWTECNFAVNVNSDFEYLYFRFLGGSRTEAYDFYVDDLVITDITVDKTANLVNGGITEKTDLVVGDALPTLEPLVDDFTERTFEFEGWYDSSLTTKYTTVTSGVTTYYAKYKNYTSYSFELGGMFDPNYKYGPTSTGIAPWWREIDPVNPNNIVMRADLSNNSNTTHFALQLLEGVNDGYKLTENKKYIITFKYYIQTESSHKIPTFSVRGSALSNIGIAGGKTNSYNSDSLTGFGVWNDSALMVLTDEQVVTSPYLILLLQRQDAPNYKVYIDDVVVREFEGSDDVSVYSIANNIDYNDHGDISNIDKTYVGAPTVSPKNYYNATFKGWYNETLTVPYLNIPRGNITLYAKHDGSILNFENGGYFDPNGNIGSASSPYSIVTDPTNANNSVLKLTLENNVENTNVGLNASGYSTDGYKLTVGNTYEISFMYYIESLSNVSVALQFRGCKEKNIGISGGKSSSLYSKSISELNAWTGVTAKFTYTGEGFTGEENPYLVMMAQNTSSTVTVYFDDFVIKETVPEVTYGKKSMTIGGFAMGQMFKQQNIVIPSHNFSYLARMQCDELVKLIKAWNANSILTASTKIVKEDKWSLNNSHFNVYVGDVKGNPNESKYHIDTTNFTDDDYAFSVGSKSIYVNGGSTYALAMGVSELIKYLNTAGSSVATGTYVSGKYSEKIDSYSTKNYYRPTFLEDFEGTEIDTSIWNIVNGNAIDARDFVDENGNLIKAADTVDANGEVIKGHGWKSIRSPEHTYLDGNGKLIIEGAYSKEKKRFYGGMLRSHGNLEYRYGYYEVSCVTPHGAGIWTANWLTPDDSDGLYHSEIDINESFGSANNTAFNMHSWPNGAAKNIGYGKYSLDNISGCSAKKASGNFAEGFHTFGYMWDENSAKFIVDGDVQFEYRYDDKHTVTCDNGVKLDSTVLRTNDYDTFNEKLSIIVSMTTANPSSGANPILGADYWNTTNKYIVDYVHIYQIDGQEIYFYNK